jgi:hypothetical protein
MSDTNELVLLLQEMQSVAVLDTEAAHVGADEILIRLITLLAAAWSKEDRGIVQSILDKYEAIDKWFA